MSNELKLLESDMRSVEPMKRHLDLPAGHSITISLNNNVLICITASLPEKDLPQVADTREYRPHLRCAVCGTEIIGNPNYRRPSGPVCSPACLSADYGRRGRCLK